MNTTNGMNRRNSIFDHATSRARSRVRSEMEARHVFDSQLALNVRTDRSRTARAVVHARAREPVPSALNLTPCRLALACPGLCQPTRQCLSSSSRTPLFLRRIAREKPRHRHRDACVVAGDLTKNRRNCDVRE